MSTFNSTMVDDKLKGNSGPAAGQKTGGKAGKKAPKGMKKGACK